MRVSTALILTLNCLKTVHTSSGLFVCSCSIIVFTIVEHYDVEIGDVFDTNNHVRTALNTFLSLSLRSKSYIGGQTFGNMLEIPEN